MMSCYVSFRTILDINTDSFEEKPWSQPGGNESDLFNFDFTQNSRKRYCSLLVNEINILLAVLKQLIWYISAMSLQDILRLIFWHVSS